ncbi:MAG: hypothetical protein ACFFBW_07550 [Promethearchaeota archaeon]
MTVDLERKKDFLENFQKYVIQGRKLLQSANHRWADRLFTELYFEIEKNEWLGIQRKHQLIMIISNSWWMYINSLTKGINSQAEMDIIRYIDAYKRFFSFLSRLDDFYLFNNFATNLLRSFIGFENLSQKGITKFINSFCAKVSERGEYLKLIELQLLLMFLRKSVIPQEFFHFSMETLGRTLFKLEPAKRALFLYIFLENVNINYQLIDDSDEFIKIMSKILVNRIPSYLKTEFSNLGRITINQRNFNFILNDLEDLIQYLNYIGENVWIAVIIKNLFYKIERFQSFGDAVTYIRKFIDYAIARNRFEIAFEIYDFLEDIFLSKTDLGYDNILIELWVEACKKFVEMKEKKYLLQSLEKLNTHLKTPQTNAQIFHYFYTCNLLWKFKSMFFSLEQRDFWRMMFYRALFEEKDYDLARKICPYLDKNIGSQIVDPSILFRESQELQKEIYSFKNEENFSELETMAFIIKQIIFRINSDGLISFRMISQDNAMLEGKISDEFWNDAQINEIYYDLFNLNEVKKFDFTLKEFGKLLYIFLPKKIRYFFKHFEIKALDFVPEIYFILDQMAVPFEMIYDNNFFLLKYSIGYIIGEPPLGGVTFGYEDSLEEQAAVKKNKFNVLIIECTNSKNPLKWNEESKSKEIVFPFTAGINELNYIIEFFNNREEIDQFTILSGDYSTKENILSKILESNNHIIHFVGNIFYSKWNPQDSFMITNDNEILTFRSINKAIEQNQYINETLLFFNSQVFDVKGEKLQNVLRPFGEIAQNFNYNKITGIISRNYPIFDDETKEISANFYIHLFKNYSQGIALLKARQECMAKKMTKLVEEKFQTLSEEEGIINIDLESSLAISSYILFGKPWKTII